jgi:putative hemolysin
MNPLPSVLAALGLLLVRALALAAESGLAAASTDSLKERHASPSVLKAFEHLKREPEPTFAALRAVVVVALALAAALGASAGASWLSGPLSGRLGPSIASLAGMLAGAMSTAVLGLIVDLSARALAGADPAGVSVRCSVTVRWLSAAARPALKLLARVIDRLVVPFGGKASFVPPRPPLEDLERLLVEQASQPGLDPQSPRLIRNIFEMSERSARDVMIPRTRLVALDVHTAPVEILQVLAEHGHSRMPVYDGAIDQIVGVLHARDLVPMMQHPELIVVQDVLRPAHFIPWSKPVGEILREMQRRKIHMALVVDEYGGILGLVTLEDVLEVIVGDIRDEYDDDLPEIDPVSDGSFLVRASTPLAILRKTFLVEFPDGDFETVGGFLNFLAGAIPESGDKFFFAGLQFTVQERSPKRVRRVRVQRTVSSAPEPRRRREGGA